MSEPKKHRLYKSYLSLILLLFYLFVFRGSPLFLDSMVLMSVTGNFVKHGSLAISEEFEGLKKRVGPDNKSARPSLQKAQSKKKARVPFMKLKGKQGQEYSHYSPGQVLLSAPFYGIGLFINKVVKEGELIYFLDTPEHFLTMLFNPLVTIVLCLGFFNMMLLFSVSERKAFWFSLILGLGTNLFSLTRTYFVHPLTTVLVFLSFYYLFSYEQKGGSRKLLLSGVLLGYGFLTRATVLPCIFLFSVYVSIMLLKGRNSKEWSILQRGSQFSIFLLPLITSFGIKVVINYFTFEKLFFSGYQAGTFPLFVFDNLPQGLIGYLISPGRSIFIYSPVLVLFLFTWPAFFKAFKLPGFIVITIPIIWLPLYACYCVWFGGDCFGPRYLNFVIPFMLLPVAYYFRNISMRRTILCTVPFFVTGFLIQLGGSLTTFYVKPHGVSLSDYLFSFHHSQLMGMLLNISRHSFDTWLSRIWSLPQGKAIATIVLVGPLLGIFLTWFLNRTSLRDVG